MKKSISYSSNSSDRFFRRDEFRFDGECKEKNEMRERRPGNAKRNPFESLKLAIQQPVKILTGSKRNIFKLEVRDSQSTFNGQ